MKALIVAAGRGSRLEGLTAERPKCLVPLQGVPLLDRAIRTLQDAGVYKIGATTGYMGEQVRRPGLQDFRNDEWATSGIFRSCCQARNWLEDSPTLIVYGDIFFTADAIRDLVRIEADVVVAYDPNAVTLWRRRFEEPLKDLERFRIASDGLVGCIGGRPTRLDEVQGQYMGLLRVTPTGWSRLVQACDNHPPEHARQMDMTTLLQCLIDDGYSVYGVPVEGPWGEIDTPTDLALYETLFTTGDLS